MHSLSNGTNNQIVHTPHHTDWKNEFVFKYKWYQSCNKEKQKKKAEERRKTLFVNSNNKQSRKVNQMMKHKGNEKPYSSSFSIKQSKKNFFLLISKAIRNAII